MSLAGEPDRRLVLFAFVLPLVLPALARGRRRETEIVSLWTIGSMTLLPIVLLSSPRIAVSRTAAVRIAGDRDRRSRSSPARRRRSSRSSFTGRACRITPPTIGWLAQAVEQAWRETTDQPLRIVGSYDNLLYGTCSISPQRPTTYRNRRRRRSRRGSTTARIARDGIAMVCPVEDSQLHAPRPTARAAANPAARRIDVEVSRAYLGIAGSRSAS